MASSQGMRRAAVTGASGFIGRALLARLNAAGWQVSAISRSAGPQPDGVRRVVLADYNDSDRLAGALHGVGAVVHLAARAHCAGTDADFDPSVKAAAAVARAARAVGARRFVLLSSIGVNGTVTGERAFCESDPPAPTEPYARSKLRAEQEVASALAGSATALTILRPPLVYGANAPGNFGKLVQAVARGTWLPLAGVHNARSLIGLDNLLDLVTVCLDHPAAANQLFLAADGDDFSTPEIVRLIAQGLDRPPRLGWLPPEMLRIVATLVGRPRLAESLCDSLRIDSSKARRVLGWVPSLPAAEGMRRAARETGRKR